MSEVRGMRLLSTVELGAGMLGGEGLAMHVGAGGRRTLFVASEHAPGDFAAVDVTDPLHPKVVCRHELPGDHLRSNNLSIVDDLLAVTRQASTPGGRPAGVEFFDISDPAEPRSVGFFDASGGVSLGTHFVWLAGDGFAYLASGAAEYRPHDRRDRFVLRILDVEAPERPAEVGRWWLPGLSEGDELPPPTRPAERLAASLGETLTDEQRTARRVDIGGLSSWDFGFRVHNVSVLPECPGRAYVAGTSGGAYILDIEDRSRPALIGRLEYAAPLAAAAHTFVPLGASGMALLSDETLEEGAADAPQNVWVVDCRIESRPLIVGSLDLPWPEEVPATGRFGAHNLHEYPLGQGAMRSFGIAGCSLFGLGVLCYDVSDPFRPRELARFVPGPDADGPARGQLNDLFIDDRAVLYTVDRKSDRCYCLEIEGATS